VWRTVVIESGVDGPPPGVARVAFTQPVGLRGAVGPNHGVRRGEGQPAAVSSDKAFFSVTSPRRVAAFTVEGGYTDWSVTDRRVLKKINDLITEIKRSPYGGIGKTGMPSPHRGKRLVAAHHRAGHTNSRIYIGI
jgi:toxin YoeB